MNGPQDLGGRDGFGPVVPELNEPVFHAGWEPRILALTLAMGAAGQWTLDESRHARESLPPADYLSFSYYRIWLEALIILLERHGFIEQDAVGKGRDDTPARPGMRVLMADAVAAGLAAGSPADRPVDTRPKFAPGDRVVTRLAAPTGHTRLPAYATGRPGVIHAVHGAHVLPDSNAHGKGEAPDWLYSVRFDAADLWGQDTTASAVHLDLWEAYLASA